MLFAFPVIGAASLGAQARAPLMPGAIVRWFGPNGVEVATAMVVNIAHDSVFVRADSNAATVVVPTAEMGSLEVRGDREPSGRHALVGAGVGLGMMGFFGFALGKDCSEPGHGFVCFSRLDGIKYLGGFGAVVGLLIGAAVPPGWHWLPADLPRTSPVAVGPYVGWGRGAELGLRIRF